MEQVAKTADDVAQGWLLRIVQALREKVPHQAEGRTDHQHMDWMLTSRDRWLPQTEEEAGLLRHACALLAANGMAAPDDARDAARQEQATELRNEQEGLAPLLVGLTRRSDGAYELRGHRRSEVRDAARRDMRITQLLQEISREREARRGNLWPECLMPDVEHLKSAGQDAIRPLMWAMFTAAAMDEIEGQTLDGLAQLVVEAPDCPLRYEALVHLCLHPGVDKWELRRRILSADGAGTAVAAALTAIRGQGETVYGYPSPTDLVWLLLDAKAADIDAIFGAILTAWPSAITRTVSVLGDYEELGPQLRDLFACPTFRSWTQATTGLDFLSYEEELRKVHVPEAGAELASAGQI